MSYNNDPRRKKRLDNDDNNYRKRRDKRRRRRRDFDDIEERKIPLERERNEYQRPNQAKTLVPHQNQSRIDFDKHLEKPRKKLFWLWIKICRHETIWFISLMLHLGYATIYCLGTYCETFDKSSGYKSGDVIGTGIVYYILLLIVLKCLSPFLDKKPIDYQEVFSSKNLILNIIDIYLSIFALLFLMPMIGFIVHLTIQEISLYVTRLDYENFTPFSDIGLALEIMNDYSITDVLGKYGQEGDLVNRFTLLSLELLDYEWFSKIYPFSTIIAFVGDLLLKVLFLVLYMIVNLIMLLTNQF